MASSGPSENLSAWIAAFELLASYQGDLVAQLEAGAEMKGVDTLRIRALLEAAQLLEAEAWQRLQGGAD